MIWHYPVQNVQLLSGFEVNWQFSLEGRHLQTVISKVQTAVCITLHHMHPICKTLAVLHAVPGLMGKSQVRVTGCSLQGPWTELPGRFLSTCYNVLLITMSISSILHSTHRPCQWITEWTIQQLLLKRTNSPTHTCN